MSPIGVHPCKGISGFFLVLPPPEEDVHPELDQPNLGKTPLKSEILGRQQLLTGVGPDHNPVLLPNLNKSDLHNSLLMGID